MPGACAVAALFWFMSSIREEKLVLVQRHANRWVGGDLPGETSSRALTLRGEFPGLLSQGISRNTIPNPPRSLSLPLMDRLGTGRGHKIALSDRHGTHSPLMTARTTSFAVSSCEIILLSILFYLYIYLCVYLSCVHRFILLNP